MGEKGARLTRASESFQDDVVARLDPLGGISSRKMFGGYGIFESSAMFALVNSQGELFLKADASNRPQFEQNGAKQHGKMPYFQPPPEVLANSDSLRDWAQVSIAVAHANKKK